MPGRLVKGRQTMKVCRYCQKVLSKKEVDTHAFVCYVMNLEEFDWSEVIISNGEIDKMAINKYDCK